MKAHLNGERRKFWLKCCYCIDVVCTFWRNSAFFQVCLENCAKIYLFLQQPQALSRNTPHVFVSFFSFSFSSTICKVTTERSSRNFLSLFACVCVCAWHSLVCSVLICQSLFSFLSSVCGQKTLCETLLKPMKKPSCMVTLCLTRLCWGLILFPNKLIILS